MNDRPQGTSWETPVVEQLKEERARLEEQVNAAQPRIRQLTVAIDALEGKTKETPLKSNEGPSVPELVELVARQLTPGTIFDHKILVLQAAEHCPENLDKIKRGIYSAMATLTKKGKFNRVPGGFKVSP